MIILTECGKRIGKFDTVSDAKEYLKNTWGEGEELEWIGDKLPIYHQQFTILEEDLTMKTVIFSEKQIKDELISFYADHLINNRGKVVNSLYRNGNINFIPNLATTTQELAKLYLNLNLGEKYNDTADQILVECKNIGGSADTGYFLGWKRTPYIRVEFDLNYTGGNYDGVGNFAYIPLSLVEEIALPLAFKRVTHIDSVHIIQYSVDELYTREGELMKHP